MTGTYGAGQLSWPDCLNVRDLGGLPTERGGRIRAGALVRSDNLDRLTDAGVVAVRQAGVRRVVDVRSMWECKKFPSPFAGDRIWQNRPVADPDVPADSALSLIEQYVALLDRNPRRLAVTVEAVSDAPVGCVVVACHSGKDRTGVVIALVLSIAGVPSETIAADYATLGASVNAVIGIDEVPPTDLPELQPPRQDTMLAVLDHVTDRYGSVMAYLAEGGFTPHQARALTARLCEPRT